MTKALSALPDTNQNFWQLACIQIATYGLPCILIGSFVAKEFGVGTASISILIGNLVLWMVGRGMIAMSSEGRNNAIQNVGNYFGIVGAVIANLVLAAVFLIWYPINLGFFVTALDAVIPGHLSIFNYFGIALGVLTALMAVGGIILIRRICSVAFLILLGLFFLSFFLFESNFIFGDFNFSLLGTVSVILVSLGGMINIPTFFRHSRSREDSVVGLTLMTVFVSLFQFLGIISGFFSKFNGVNNLYDCNYLCILFAVLFVFVSSICANLGNIYFSSAVLEFFLPKTRKSIGYILIGLCGSLFYAIFGFADSFTHIENIVEGFIVNLSIVLLMGFTCKIVMQRRPKFIEKLANNICWIFGCIASFYVANQSVSNYYGSFFVGIVTVVLCFVFFLFVEKTVESIKNL